MNNKNNEVNVKVILIFFLLISSSSLKAQDLPYHEQVVFTDYPLASNVGSTGVADLNGDGLDDLVTIDVANFNNDDPQATFRIFLNENGTLVDRTDEVFDGDLSSFTGPRTWHFADFNSDGYLDMFFASHGQETTFPFPGEQNQLVLSNGDGTWALATENLPQIHDFTHGASIGDLDNDGDIDILINNLGGSGEVVLDQNGEQVFYYILVNDGNGVFTRDIDTLAVACQKEIRSRCQHFWTDTIDANNDGLTDIYLGNNQTFPENNDIGQQYILLQQPDASYVISPDALPEAIDDGFGVPQGSKVFDVNNDGLDDLVILDTDLNNANTPDINDDAVRIFISNGDGTFRDESSFRIDLSVPDPADFQVSDFYVKDFDEDGFQDLIVYRPDYADGIIYYTIHLNDGSGIFRRLSLDVFTGNEPFMAPINLVNGDGGLDFINHGAIATLFRVKKSYGPEFLGDGANNRIIGGTRDEEFQGMGGGDVILGGDGSDLLDGGDGEDYLSGENGGDTIIGGSGSDTLFGGNGINDLDGGSGTDTAIYLEDRDQFDVRIVSGGYAVENSNNSIQDTLADIENISFNGEVFPLSITDDNDNGTPDSLDPIVAPRKVSGARNVQGQGTSPGTNVEFSLQMTLQGGETLLDSVSINKMISITASVIPETSDIGQSADFYMVNIGPAGLRMRNVDGAWETWNGAVSGLVPFRENLVLENSLELEVFSGQLDVAGSQKIFIGFKVGDVLYFTPQALKFDITN